MVKSKGEILVSCPNVNNNNYEVLLKRVFSFTVEFRVSLKKI
jgi:hypothetical protein